MLSYRDGIGNGCLCMVGLVNILKFFILSNKYIYEFGYLTGVRRFGVYVAEYWHYVILTWLLILMTHCIAKYDIYNYI